MLPTDIFSELPFLQVHERHPTFVKRVDFLRKAMEMAVHNLLTLEGYKKLRYKEYLHFDIWSELVVSFIPEEFREMNSLDPGIYISSVCVV